MMVSVLSFLISLREDGDKHAQLVLDSVSKDALEQAADPGSPQAAWLAYKYAHAIKSRVEVFEPVVLCDALAACSYAQYLVKGRWPEAEPVILTNPQMIYEYATKVIVAPWPEGGAALKEFGDGYWFERYNAWAERGAWARRDAPKQRFY